jgi:hypothetical protein
MTGTLICAAAWLGINAALVGLRLRVVGRASQHDGRSRGRANELFQVQAIVKGTIVSASVLQEVATSAYCHEPRGPGREAALPTRADLALSRHPRNNEERSTDRRNTCHR